MVEPVGCGQSRSETDRDSGSRRHGHTRVWTHETRGELGGDVMNLDHLAAVTAQSIVAGFSAANSPGRDKVETVIRKALGIVQERASTAAFAAGPTDLGTDPDLRTFCRQGDALRVRCGIYIGLEQDWPHRSM